MTASTTHSPSAKAREYQARVVGIDDVLPDTRILVVELDNRQKLAFEAGQYAMIALPGLDPRPFSIASTPDQPVLEFHIRNTGKGSGARALEELKIGQPLSISGPFGSNHWHASPRPVLAIAGGMGIAPLKAIIETHLSKTTHTPLWLYWGVRGEDQLYLHHLFQRLAQQYPRFSYIPVLSEAGDHARYRTGMMLPHLVEDFPQLAEFSIYMAGPAIMVDSMLPTLLQHGADPQYIFCDGMEIAGKKG